MAKYDLRHFSTLFPIGVNVSINACIIRKSVCSSAVAEVTVCSRNALDWYIITCIQHVYVCMYVFRVSTTANCLP